jgi:transcriptional repressor NrdR
VKCPFCGSTSQRVVDSRDAGDAIRRRRECEGCGERFTTYERAEALRMYVVKRDGRRERFDRDKLLRGLERAVAAGKRPLDTEQLNELVDEIADAVRRRGGEADAQLVGDMALGGLARLDRVSAVLFASVYRQIQDLSEFEAELRRLESEPVAGPDQLAIEVLHDGPVPSAPKSSLAPPSGGSPNGRRTARTVERRGHASHT